MDEINIQVAAKGTELMKQGDAALKRFSIAGMFGNGSNNEAALEKYTQAANNYKMAKDWRSCAAANIKCADMATAMGSKHEAANFYVQAGDAMKRVDAGQAADHYRAAVDIYCDMGRFATAAKQLESIGELYETADKIDEAIKSFKQAADFYSGENQAAKALKLSERVAFHSATLKRYDVSVKLFEELGGQSVQNSLLTFGAKKHFMHAVFCHLARGDSLAAQQGFVKYSQMDFSFGDSREGKLCKDLIEATEKQDAELFSQKLFEYDSISKLTKWETTVLLQAKSHLEGGAAGAEDDGPDIQ